MPPKTTLSGRPHPARAAWHNPPQGRNYSGRPEVGSLPNTGSGFKRRSTAGPMQQQEERRHQHEPLLQQRAGSNKAQV